MDPIMNEVWNLDPIYKGFEDPAVEADLRAAKANRSFDSSHFGRAGCDEKHADVTVIKSCFGFCLFSLARRSFLL